MHMLRLRRVVAPAAVILSSAALAAPAHAQRPTGAPAVPFVGIGTNTAEITAEEFDPGTVTVKRNGATLATGTFVDSTEPGRTIFTVNSAEIAGLGLPVGCWTGFTPQILPGDVVTVGTEAPITIPDVTAEKAVQVGDSVVVRGTATGLDPAMPLSVQIWAASGKFTNPRIGLSGGQFIDTSSAGSLTFTDATHFTATFPNLAGNLPDALNGTAIAAMASPDVVGAGTLFSVDYQAGGVAADNGGCGAPYSPDEARTVSRPLINVANAGTDLTVTGVSHPGASLTGITLTDSAGKIVTAPAVGGTAWSATVPAASLASLGDGPISIGTSLATLGKGATVKNLLTKDTTAPAAPTASVAAGTYTSTQSVALKAAEGTVRYTTDGSDPTASSAAYSKAISVASSQTIKAVAVDAAGNVSDVASFGYTIAPPVAAPAPAPAPAPVVAPKLKLDALTIGSSYRLKTVRKRGISLVVFAPEGAKVIKVRLLRNGHVVTRLIRKVSSDGVMTVTLPTTKTGRRHLKRGVYKVQVTPGQSASHYGVTTTRTVRIR